MSSKPRKPEAARKETHDRIYRLISDLDESLADCVKELLLRDLEFAGRSDTTKYEYTPAEDCFDVLFREYNKLGLTKTLEDVGKLVQKYFARGKRPEVICEARYKEVCNYSIS